MRNPETDPRRPTVQLVGHDGNAFAVMGRVAKALRRAGYTDEEVTQFTDEAKAGSYDELLVTCMRWADCR